MDDLTYLFFGALIAGLIGTAIGASKGRPGAGFFFGFILGPIGWIIIAVGPNEKRDDLEGLMRSAAPNPTAADPTAALLNLKQLLDAGAITQAEFDAKKPMLLAQVGQPTTPREPYRIHGLNDR